MLRRNIKDIPMSALRVQLVTPEEFIRLSEKRGADILTARIIPPRLGNKDFGMILIEWKRPVFVTDDMARRLAFTVS
jgi:hypothetical protein